ncbi:type II toxin-antitoxin system HicB family antitoxin [Patescibacteria group bacterium]|nr:type II toxin-antitoxin system HicB family antitoxin [Patescibacteria group bacterium]MBU4511884.1 type II toxin-antitoxin system HicB family antitoxin [Patescibacteria group bacterium]MCG2692852.1 type II toxin-antitoxin system HicB family antitoxin [Candidatus Parcubacteria bacterium]
MKKVLTKNKSVGLTKTYIFRVVVEPDEDRWFACCPALESQGAATWGYTKEEALKNIQEVLEMIAEEMTEDGEEIPIKVQERQRVTFDLPIAVSV